MMAELKAASWYLNQWQHLQNQLADHRHVQVLAVSKAHPLEALQRFAQACQQHAQQPQWFGENYAQELIAKAQAWAELADAPPMRWSYIGQLQSNKIKGLVQWADEIQTVASLKHARTCNQAAIACGKEAFPVWLHINAAEEPQKPGIAPAAAPALASQIIAECPQLALQGILSIPPAQIQDGGNAAVPPLYQELRDLALQIGVGRLSLGMSGDLQLALAAGSDCIRIGTALFGPRPARP